jgi:hypothetical protein
MVVISGFFQRAPKPKQGIGLSIKMSGEPFSFELSQLRFLLPRPDANCDVTRADGACSDVQGTELLGLDFLDSIIIGDADWTI